MSHEFKTQASQSLNTQHPPTRGGPNATYRNLGN